MLIVILFIIIHARKGSSVNYRKFLPIRFRNFWEFPKLGKLPEFWKFPEKFSPKNSRKLRVFFTTNVMLQRVNYYFYYYKRPVITGKFRENFGENFRNVKNSRKNFLRKISRKFRGVFSVKCNVTEQKSIFLCL